VQNNRSFSLIFLPLTLKSNYIIQYLKCLDHKLLRGMDIPRRTTPSVTDGNNESIGLFRQFIEYLLILHHDMKADDLSPFGADQFVLLGNLFPEAL